MGLFAPSLIENYGGKRRWAKQILARLEPCTVYVEPFAGSLAVLLSSEPHQREIVTDSDGFIINFWRAMQFDHEAVAFYSDWPTYHHDLTARHRWLLKWGAENGPRLSEDPEYYDAKVAGWWCWGISNWIGGGWCSSQTDDTFEKRPHVQPKGGGNGVAVNRYNLPHDKRPYVNDRGGGHGVNAQREALPGDTIPYMGKQPGGRGVAAQRSELPSRDQIPKIPSYTGGSGVQGQRTDLPSGPDKIPKQLANFGGHGVQVQRETLPDKRPLVHNSGTGVGARRRDLEGDIGTGARLLPWFRQIQQRLARVVVLNRDWTSAVTPTLLMHTATAPKPPVGILLDPPYRTTTGRSETLYTSDAQATSEDTAVAAYEWAIAHGETYRIAYCCREGDFDVPDGWDVEYSTFKGVKVEERRGVREMILFSPACTPDESQEQLGLW